MKVLLIGSGAREHALAWHLRKQGGVEELFIAPGNPGTEGLGQNLPIGATEVQNLVAWAKLEKPDWVVVGPEAPLCLGLADRLENEAGIPVLGPQKDAALLEGSKAATKELLLREGIPTARGESASSFQEAVRISQRIGYPQVIKADGLAAGKGVFIVQRKEEAEHVLEELLVEGKLGEAGKAVVLEEYLRGEELSVFVFLHEDQWVFLGTARDYKRLGENDQGPNTGGMGAYSPVEWAGVSLLAAIRDRILLPLLGALSRRGIRYRGILYGGLLCNREGPHVLEFNVRLGDPEAQVLLPLLPVSLVELWEAARQGELKEALFLETRSPEGRVAVGVVVAAQGYPESPVLREPLQGVPLGVEAGDGKLLFLGGVRKGPKGELLTSGGRVATAVGLGADKAQARRRAYELASQVCFPSAFFRRDVAQERNLPEKSLGLRG
jgi:phosphoribosylamine--glycine ligase